MPKVTKIPQTINPLTRQPNASVVKRRVAGYARVSTDSDEQFTSYEAQVDYYTRFIQSKSEWEFVGVYTDEGISGCSTSKREGFKNMISDALAGKIDLIITKSVSRFARNTVDSLTTIRMLKDKGVECFFEKEGIYTFDGKGELLITIMSSLAQEESRSISENVTWGQRKRFSDGKVTMAYKHFLGYKRGADGKPEIVPQEAEIVRLIYRLFIDGKTAASIAKHLTDLQIPTPTGKTKWSQSTVMSILTNEKYKGDALLQKTFTIDFLEKKMKPNEGEVPKYYVEDSHPAIIDSEEWALVQTEVARRKTAGRTYSSKGIFSSKLICEECSSFFGSKVWHSTDKYRCTIWQCNNKFKNKQKCTTPIIREGRLKQLFIKAYNELMQNRQQVIDDCQLMRECLSSQANLDDRIDSLQAEFQVISRLVKDLINSNATRAMKQSDYQAEYDKLNNRYHATVTELEALQAKRISQSQQDKAMLLFIKKLKEQPAVLDSFNEEVWSIMVDRTVVHTNGDVSFVFYNGKEIRVGD